MQINVFNWETKEDYENIFFYYEQLSFLKRMNKNLFPFKNDGYLLLLADVGSCLMYFENDGGLLQNYVKCCSLFYLKSYPGT